ncbi:MAG: hypothetical protein RL335_919, partial [Bacteroidota bacterium]
IDLPGILNGAHQITDAEIATLKELEVPYTFSNVVGFQITNLYEFFMLFVVMAGIASLLLFLLNKWLRGLMNSQ